VWIFHVCPERIGLFSRICFPIFRLILKSAGWEKILLIIPRPVKGFAKCHPFVTSGILSSAGMVRGARNSRRRPVSGRVVRVFRGSSPARLATGRALAGADWVVFG